DIYDAMRQKDLLETGAVTKEDAYSLIKSLAEQGKDALYIGFSSQLSATYDVISGALEQVQQEHPERKLMSVDSMGVALGEGLVVKYAIDLRGEGKEIEEVYEWIVQNRLFICQEFTVDDLYYLKRSKKISSTLAVFGSAMNVKPLIYTDDKGALATFESARGRKKSLDCLVESVKEYAIRPEEQTIYISHGDSREDAEYLAQRLKEEVNVKDIMIRVLDPVMGIHSGPGALAVFYYGEHRQMRVVGDKKIHIFLVNPYAGIQNFADELRDVLEKIEGLEYYIFSTRYPGSEQEIVKQVLDIFEGEKIRFYSCGGSGTFRNMLNGFDDLSNVEVAFYPKGLSNDFLKVFGKDEKRFYDIRELIHGDVIDVDYIQTNHGVCLNTISTGIDSLMLTAMNKYRFVTVFGKLFPYNASLFEAVLSFKNVMLNIDIDGENHNCKCGELLFANGFVLGGNMYFDQGANPTDGEGIYCLVAEKSRLELVKGLRLTQKKKIKTLHEKFQCGKWKKVKVSREDGKPLVINQDGELVYDHCDWEFEIKNKGLHLVVPKGVKL
ncbi:MAG: DegV family EDD domain-containing protein, partial [Eubacterium sp.]|nr:DegV family EDD domain-containing protein [Eubacterium sp.]